MTGDAPEVISDLTMTTRFTAVEPPQALFYEDDTAFMFWRDAWWIRLAGFWFQPHSRQLDKMLAARWTHLHQHLPGEKS